jgi:DNA-directed RNA polymerase subunit RPC12/RpoP
MAKEEKKQEPVKAEPAKPVGTVCSKCGKRMTVQTTKRIMQDNMAYPAFLCVKIEMATRIRTYKCEGCGRSVNHTSEEAVSL